MLKLSRNALCDLESIAFIRFNGNVSECATIYLKSGEIVSVQDVTAGDWERICYEIEWRRRLSERGIAEANAKRLDFLDSDGSFEIITPDDGVWSVVEYRRSGGKPVIIGEDSYVREAIDQVMAKVKAEAEGRER